MQATSNLKFDPNNKNQIMAVWKPLGISTHVISTQVSQIMQVPVAHTGTLDPMAEGVIVLLTGDERFKKYELAGWQKEYEFQVLFGLSTDTYDLMGFLQNVDLNFKLNNAQLNQTLKEFTKTYQQQYPPFAAKKVKGKPLHYYAQTNTLDQIQIPTLSATIYELDLISIQTLTRDEIYNTATEKIKKVQGFFRQQEILNDWDQFSSKITSNSIFYTANLKALVSRGVYVRTLAVDIATHLNTLALVSDLIRTKNGNFYQENCIDYEEILAYLNLNN